MIIWSLYPPGMVIGSTVFHGRAPKLNILTFNPINILGLLIRQILMSQHADENIELNFDAHEKDTQNWMGYGLRSQEQLSEKSNIGAP